LDLHQPLKPASLEPETSEAGLGKGHSELKFEKKWNNSITHDQISFQNYISVEKGLKR